MILDRASAVRAIALTSAIVAISMTAAPSMAGAAPTPDVTEYFTSQEIARAAQYRGPRYALGLSGLALGIAVLAIIAFVPRIRAWMPDAGSWWTRALIATAVVTVVPMVVRLPLGILRWRHDRRWGLATNSLGGYLTDVAKALGFELIVFAVAAILFVGIARGLPRSWPLVVGAIGGVLTFVLVFLFPLVYEPAFNTFTPVDPALRARVVALAEKAGVHVRDVLVADASRRTTRQNAYVSGIGASKRVVLYDTLLRKSSPREVDLVVAHELVHQKHGDVMRGTLLAVGGVVAGVAALWVALRVGRVRTLLGIEGPGDPNVVLFLAFFIAATSVVTLPVTNWVSRMVEARADRTAIELTDDPDAAIRLEVNLAKDNIDDLTPNPVIRFVFFSHPPVMERIGIARDYLMRS